MPRSQNGYSANDRSLIHNPVVPGTDVRLPGGVRKGPAGDLLLWVFGEFHRRVEPLVKGHCWGYAERKVRGDDDDGDWSNHASGTAGDGNAPAHPLGKRGTFTAAQVREIRAILAEAEGCVRWGGDYSGRADEMHFEIVKPEADCARVLAKIRGTQEDDMAQFTDAHARMLADLHHYYVARDWANLPDQPPGTGTAMEMLSQIHEVLTAPIGSEVDKGKTQASVRQFVAWIDKASHETRTELRALAAEVIARLDKLEGAK